MDEMNVTSSRHQRFPAGEIIFMTGSFVFLIPMIIMGNLLVIASYTTNHLLHTRTYTLLVSLAVSDFLVGGINLPMWIYCMLEYHKCNGTMFKFFDLFGAFASILHLTAISIERYIAIVKPFVYARLPSIVHRGTMVFIWIFPAFVASLSWYRPSVLYQQYYNCVVLVTGFVLPASVIVSMCVGIFRAAKSLIQRTPSFNQEGLTKKRISEDRKVMVTVAVISGLFIIAWLPFFVLSIIAYFCGRCIPSDPSDVLRMVAVVKWLHYSNSMVNPIVYALRDREIRKTFLRILDKICCCDCVNSRYLRVNGRNVNLRNEERTKRKKETVEETVALKVICEESLAASNGYPCSSKTYV